MPNKKNNEEEGDNSHDGEAGPPDPVENAEGNGDGEHEEDHQAVPPLRAQQAVQVRVQRGHRTIEAGGCWRVRGWLGGWGGGKKMRG